MTAAATTSLSTSMLKRWQRPVLILAGAAALWTGVVGAWLPHWVKPRVEAAASEALGTPVTLAQIHVQPWTGVLTVDGLKLGPASNPLLSLQQAEVQLSLESVWRLAPVLRRVTLVKPDIWIERQSAQRFNFSPILERLMKPGKAPSPDDAPQRFAVFNIAVQDGMLRFSDRVLGQDHRIDQIHIGVPFLSNLPSAVHVEVDPLLSGRVDGSPLLIKGKTLPFDEGRKSDIHIKLYAVDVPHWLAAAHPFMPEGLKPDAHSGRLDADVTVGFEAPPPPAAPRLSIRGGVQVSKLALGLPRVPGLGAVELGWDMLKAEGLDVEPLAHRVSLSKLSWDGLQARNEQLAASVGKALQVPDAPSTARPGVGAGAAQGAQASAGDKALAASAAATVPWVWRVATLDVHTGRIDVQPLVAASARAQSSVGATTSRWPALSAVHISTQDLDSRNAAKPAAWRLEVHDEHDGTVMAQGKLHLAKQQFDAQIDVSKVQMGSWLAPIAPGLKLPLAIQQGELAMQAQLDARLLTASAVEMAAARLLSGRVQLSGVTVRATQGGSKDQIRFDALTLDGVQAQLDLSAAQPVLRQLTMDGLRISKLDAALTHGPRGQWLGMSADASALNASTPHSPDSPTSGATQKQASNRQTTKPGEPLPEIKLKSLHCEACKLQLADEAVTPAAHIDLSQADLQVADLSSNLSQFIKLDVKTLAQGKGRVQFKGDVRPNPLSVNARVQLAGLDVRAVQPYIDPLVNITVAAAKVQADGQLSLQDQGGRGLQARYKGRAGLSDLRVLDRVNDADFLSWQSLSLDGMDVLWADRALDADLGRIALKDFYGRVIINPNGQLNLAGIMRHEAGAQARSLTTPEVAGSPRAGALAPVATPLSSSSATLASAAPASAVAASPGANTAAAPPPKLRWQAIQLAKGRVDFTDNFIKPNYSARLTQIEGDVSAVSSAKPEPATIKIAGAVDDAAPLLITGQIHPLGPKLFTDIQGSAKGIELTRLTPYASRYAGYAIDKGSLSVTVHYKIDGGKLEASNQIFLDQLTFGEKTDSPDATKLPVLFAVSLLKNRKGEIDVNLPISGSLDDPDFSVGGIIWRVIVNLISKAVTAPFALLAGGGSDELGLVGFDPGSADLNDDSKQRLDTLATKLQDRPALKLEATGRADPVSDAEGLRRAHVNQLMRAAKAKATGQAPSEVSIAADERLKWLSAAYKAADIKKPRNVIGLAKTLGADEMEALLKAAAPADSEALRTLANRRGDAVKAYLATKLPPERVLLTASKVGTDGLPADDKGPTNRVQFAIK